jgi:heterodisulfide reductase subunit D
LLISGQGDKAEAMIGHNVAQVKASGASRVVVSCPSCYHIWLHTYPQVVEDMDLEVLHDTELLAELIEEGRLKLKEFPETVTYHDPCDLGRKSGLYDPPRQVLQGIPSLHLVEMADNRQNARCCGGGGNLETIDPTLSEAIAARRVAQALDTGAKYLVSACQQCKRTLTGAVRREKARLRVMDITELVARVIVS